jgi:hypothetical protein
MIRAPRQYYVFPARERVCHVAAGPPSCRFDEAVLRDDRLPNLGTTDIQAKPLVHRSPRSLLLDIDLTFLRSTSPRG